MKQLRNLLDFVRPVQLFLALLTYCLGLGLARYLGTSLRLEPGLGGAAVVLLLLMASNLLVEYFRPWNEPLTGAEMTPAEREQLRSLLLTFGAAFLCVAGMLIFLLQLGGFLRLDSALLLVVFTLLGLTAA